MEFDFGIMSSFIIRPPRDDPNSRTKNLIKHNRKELIL